MTRRVIGTMTGTSCDGLDLALLELDGQGMDLLPRFIKGQQFSLGQLGPRLRNLAEGQACTMEELCRLNHDFTSFHVECVRKANLGTVNLIVPHGQTLYHSPPHSLQLINLSLLSGKLNTPVMGDLRAMDLAKGGQGAPITPLADHFLYGCQGKKQVIVNLGGFCNLTFLPSDGSLSHIRGFDICSTNLLLDLLSRNILNRPYDEGGEGAKKGKEIPSLRKFLEEQLLQQQQLGSSLGQSHLPSLNWFNDFPFTPDLLTTACLAIGTVIGQTIKSLKADELLVAGGGAHNSVLMSAINQSSGLTPKSCDDQGPPSEYREAASMALLGALCIDKVPITLKAVTGANESFISGSYVDSKIP